MNCLSVFDHFVGLALKGLKEGLSEFCKNFQKKKKKFEEHLQIDTERTLVLYVTSL